MNGRAAAANLFSMDVQQALLEFLRIPSISSDPMYASECKRAAEWVLNFLRNAGVSNAQILEKPDRHPLVYGEWLGAPGAPTLLLYGHYDVQPPDPLELWTSPPFSPTIRGDDVFARGACDDKGQTLIWLEAVRRMLASDGRLPINLKMIVEGEEESSGLHLEEFVEAAREKLRCDAVLICDTEMFAPGMPTLCTGLRGIVYGEIQMEGAAQDLHSGAYGGAAPNAVEAVAQLIASLKSTDGLIHIPGFYDDVQSPAPEELAAWESLPFDEEHYRRTEVGSSRLTGERGYSVLERVWARPTLEVHGIGGGFTGEGAKTVIPARAFAKISCRLVPNQDPARIAALLEKAVAEAAPPGTTARWNTYSYNRASVVDPNHPMIRTAAQALETTFGRPVVYMRSGGSIPIVGLFLRELDAPSVLMGFGLPDDNLHAPNEKFHLPNLYRGIDAVIAYFRLLGAGQ